MKSSSFEARFSVVCVPENPSMFMMNMQVFQIKPVKSLEGAPQGEPQAVVWCAVFQPSGIRKI